MKIYNLDAPAAELAAEVQRDLYEQAKSGVVDYGEPSPIVSLILQFQQATRIKNELLIDARNQWGKATEQLLQERGLPTIPPTDEEFAAQFKSLLEIAGDNHDLKRAVIRVGKAHTMATVVYKDATDSNGITQSMWLWRYMNDVSMLLERLGEITPR